MADFGAAAPKFNGQPIRKRAPISRSGDRTSLRLTHLLMVPIEDYREKRGGQNIEDNDIDIRMSFDQSEHRYPLPGRCGFLFPLRASLDVRESSRAPKIPIADFMR